MDLIASSFVLNMSILNKQKIVHIEILSWKNFSSFFFRDENLHIFLLLLVLLLII